ncbi:MAG: hypothetical protein QOI64_1783, partial [Solirubrobacteraceae bacterium]|nr:hypothetical protein [Solirubrobacteraceae bacterium]
MARGGRILTAIARRKEPIPTSRVRRSAQVGKLAAGQAARQMGTRAANLTRTEEAGQAARQMGTRAVNVARSD